LQQQQQQQFAQQQQQQFAQQQQQQFVQQQQQQFGQQQAWSRPVVAPPLHQGMEEERLIGRIKHYVNLPDGGGYGFIDCEDIKLRFSRDVYIHKNQMQGMVVGDSVSFTYVRNHRGEPQARHVMRAEDALLLRPGVQAGSAAGGPAMAASQASMSAGANMMDEQQARKFQASLRGDYVR